MQTQCNRKKYEFQGLNRRRVEANFNGGCITSDAGGLLLREVEARSGIIRQFSDCFQDYRDEDMTEHSVLELVKQRVYGLGLGYEDLNDHDDLRHDPLLATLVGKPDPTGQDRLQAQDKGKPLDATDDPLHGEQEGRFFHGYYKSYCYLPLYIFCGDHLLCARLRESNIDASSGAVEELKRVVDLIRQKWPEVEIVIRGDSGFCREEIMAWCEENGVDYVLGIAKNARLKAALLEELEEAKGLYEQTGRASRVYKDFTYRTLKSWSRERRVVGKAEHLAKGSNPRFVVSSISSEQIDGKRLYEDTYCARGDMENRIKEHQLCLFSDRTSTAYLRSNQLRLWFSSVAYVLINAFRKIGLKGTKMARAQCHTIREKLFKIGASVMISVRRVVIMLASGCPYQSVFSVAYRNLRAVVFTRYG